MEISRQRRAAVLVHWPWSDRGKVARARGYGVCGGESGPLQEWSMSVPGSPRTVRIALPLGAALAVLVGGALTAAATTPRSLSGSLTSSLYVLDRADTTGEGTTHAHASQILRLAHVRGALSLRFHGRCRLVLLGRFELPVCYRAEQRRR